jgi:hypothetical protein
VDGAVDVEEDVDEEEDVEEDNKPRRVILG